MSDITGIWIDEAQHLDQKTIERIRSMTGGGFSYFLVDGDVVEVTPNDTVVAQATVKSSHGAPYFPLDPQKSAV